MVKIAICEDEKLFRDKLSVLMKKYFQEKRIPYEIALYEKGEQLLEVNHKKYDILCLDVEIRNGIDGITLAKRLRAEDNKAQIVFLTSHQEEAYKAFEVSAFRYLLKPLQEDILEETMGLLMLRVRENWENNVIFKVNQGLIKIKFDEILYLETFERKLKVSTIGRDYIVDLKISEIESQLKNRFFFRIHRSVIVNLQYIKKHNNSTVTIDNGKTFPISRLKLPAFKEEFVRYLKV